MSLWMENYMKKAIVLLLGLSLIMLTACSAEEEEQTRELYISAAASLTDAMDELKEIYEAESEIELTFNFAGSGKLAQQIQQGAPVDVFISANENWLNRLVEDELIEHDTIRDVTGNKLVLIANHLSSFDYDSFSDLDIGVLSNIAIGQPESVPAGEYTKKALENMDKWDEIEPHVVYAKDVRQVLTYVETGNVEVGFVYKSDALSSDKVIVLTESDPSQHDPIIYPGGITSDSEHKEAAKDFLEFVTSDEAQEVLATYGFSK